MITGLLIFAGMLVVSEAICYAYLLFTIPPKPWHLGLFSQYLGRGAYGIAYLLSLLRAPLGLVPYLVKAFIFFGLRISYESPQTTYTRELLNMAGDVLNLACTTLFVSILVGLPPMKSPAWLLYLPLMAELVRLLTERIPISFSVAWQLLPHRAIALRLQAWQHTHAFWHIATRLLANYCRYYMLTEADRAQYVLDRFKQYARRDEDLARRLEYIHAFRIVPQHHGLRSGHVRDVARGEVFIHGIWTNDPWVLMGIALRRTSWMFDPRYLRRPFYYMTEANPLATLFVLEHGKYSLPYAIFQFGHEIRVARLHLFYYLLRKLGIDIEARVLADGTFEFDQFLFHLARKVGLQHTPPQKRLLCSDEEVIADFMQLHETREGLTARDIAIRYTYPLQYVEEVLLPQIDAARP